MEVVIDRGYDKHGKFMSLVAELLYGLDPHEKIGAIEEVGYCALYEGAAHEMIQEALSEEDKDLPEYLLAVLEVNSAGAILEESEDGVSLAVFEDEDEMNEYWEQLDAAYADRLANQDFEDGE